METIKKANTIYFTSEHIKAGVLNDFILLMYKYSLNSNNYVDIHIKPIDLGEVEVEWTYVPKDNSNNNGKFEFVSADQVVLTKDIFPDRCYKYLTDNEIKYALEKQIVEKRAKENNWVKNQFGQQEKKTTNDDELKKWKEENL